MIQQREAKVLWLLVVPLALLGGTLAVTRSIGVIESRLSGEDPPPELSRFDRGATPVLARLIGARPGSSKHRQLEDEVRRFYAKFNRHPVATLLHVGPAALIMLLVPLQLSARIRQRFTAWHRWSGRLIVALAIPAGLSGLFFGLFMPFVGTPEAAAITVFGGWFFFALSRGVLAIRGGDVPHHREWMLRMFAVAIGVVVVRLVGLPLALATGEPPAAWFGQSIWIGFGIAVGAAEILIRHSRRRPSPSLLPRGRRPGSPA